MNLFSLDGTIRGIFLLKIDPVWWYVSQQFHRPISNAVLSRNGERKRMKRTKEFKRITCTFWEQMASLVNNYLVIVCTILPRICKGELNSCYRIPLRERNSVFRHSVLSWVLDVVIPPLCYNFNDLIVRPTVKLNFCSKIPCLVLLPVGSDVVRQCFRDAMFQTQLSLISLWMCVLYRCKVIDEESIILRFFTKVPACLHFVLKRRLVTI